MKLQLKKLKIKLKKGMERIEIERAINSKIAEVLGYTYKEDLPAPVVRTTDSMILEAIPAPPEEARAVTQELEASQIEGVEEIGEELKKLKEETLEQGVLDFLDRQGPILITPKEGDIIDLEKELTVTLQTNEDLQFLVIIESDEIILGLINGKLKSARLGNNLSKTGILWITNSAFIVKNKKINTRLLGSYLRTENSTLTVSQSGEEKTIKRIQVKLANKKSHLIKELKRLTERFLSEGIIQEDLDQAIEFVNSYGTEELKKKPKEEEIDENTIIRTSRKILKINAGNKGMAREVTNTIKSDSELSALIEDILSLDQEIEEIEIKVE